MISLCNLAEQQETRFALSGLNPAKIVRLIVAGDGLSIAVGSMYHIVVFSLIRDVKPVSIKVPYLAWSGPVMNWDGSRLVSAHLNDTRVWKIDFSLPQSLPLFILPGCGQHVVVSRDGNLVLTWDSTYLLAFQLGRVYRRIRDTHLKAVALSPDKQIVLLVSQDSLHVRNLTAGTVLRSIRCEPDTTSLLFSPDGRWFVCLSLKHVLVFKTRSFVSLNTDHGTIIYEALSAPSKCRALRAAFNADSSMFAVCDNLDITLPDVLIQVWQTRDFTAPPFSSSLSAGGVSIAFLTPCKQLRAIWLGAEPTKALSLDCLQT